LAYVYDSFTNLGPLDGLSIFREGSLVRHYEFMYWWDD